MVSFASVFYISKFRETDINKKLVKANIEKIRAKKDKINTEIEVLDNKKEKISNLLINEFPED